MGVYLPIKDYSAMQGPAPDGFHVPLTTEWQGLKTIMDGFSLTTGANWRENLHMPFVGYRLQSNAVVGSQGSNGFYWSSSPYGDAYPKRARTIFLNSSKVNANDSYYTRSRGCSIRCFKNSFTVPTSSWTVITGTLGGAGIFRNQTEGLISITSDGTTGYTIQDKNLGATTVYNNGDTLTQANMGKMYQWGNNYGFPSTGSVTTSSTQVDASNYGPGNYYSSSTFITGSDDWSSVQNDNLWGATTGVSPMSELKNAYIGEYIEQTYTISNVPNDNSNVYVNIAKSGKTVKEVTFELTANNNGATSSSARSCYFRISGSNNTTNRYGGAAQFYNGGNVNTFKVLGRINNNTDTEFKTGPSLQTNGINTLKLVIGRDGGTKIVNGASESWTYTTAEKNIVDTIMNSSTINAYVSREGGVTISTVNITVTYS